MIKNYTSEVPVYRTINEIEAKLVAAGILQVMKDFQGGEVFGLYFSLPAPDRPGVSIPVRMPVDVDAVVKILRESRKGRMTRDAELRILEQARRTAWRVMKDWLDIQLTLIELGQAEKIQVFLPYVWDGQRTHYEKIKAADFKALPVHVDERITEGRKALPAGKPGDKEGA